MKLKQRDANREALEQAAAIIEASDLESLFASYGDAQSASEDQHNEIVLEKAQRYAVERIRKLATRGKP